VVGSTGSGTILVRHPGLIQQPNLEGPDGHPKRPEAGPLNLILEAP